MSPTGRKEFASGIDWLVFISQFPVGACQVNRGAPTGLKVCCRTVNSARATPCKSNVPERLTLTFALAIGLCAIPQSDVRHRT